MTVKEAIDQFRIILHDVSEEYDDYHAVMRLNSALQLTSALLVQINSPLVIQSAALHNGDTLPPNFQRFCGIYPIKRTGQTVELLEDEEAIVTRYYVAFDALTAAGDMPFAHDAMNDFVIRTAAKYALNRNEFDISQDQSLLQELQNAAAAAMG